MGDVEVLGHIGPDGPGLFVLYTGGTIGMGPGPDGALVPLDLRELGVHLPFVRRLPIGLTVATLANPIDSSAMGTSDWIAIGDSGQGHRRSDRSAPDDPTSSQREARLCVTRQSLSRGTDSATSPPSMRR